jgi:hypothetical protein
MEVRLAEVRVMYWKEIPVQVQARDRSGQVSRPLAPRFQEAADAVAMFDGSAGSDAYLESWGYGPFFEVAGTASAAADQLAARFNEAMPADFVARIRDLHRAGLRNPTPGAIDKWAGIDTPAAR